MTIADGTYVILSKSNTGKALDARYALDQSGDRVWLWPRNDTDAQLVYIYTNSNGTRTLRFPLTGCVLHASAASNNSPMYQKDREANSGFQEFVVTDAGTTTTVNGNPCQNGTIYLASNSNLRVAIGPDYTDGTHTAPEIDLKTYSANDTTQQWVFYPMYVVPDGTYQIVSEISEGVSLDVEWDAAANGTNVQLWTTHDSTESNAQVWVVHNGNDGTATIRHSTTTKLLDGNLDENGVPQSGTNAVIWEESQTRDQKWLIKPHGEVARDSGIVEPTYEIRCHAGVNILLDACGGNSTPGTNVWMWHEDYWAPGQHWAFRPTEAFVGLPVPTSIKHDFGDASPAITKATTGVFTVFPNWCGSGSPWQVRFRWRSRLAEKADNSYRGAWTNWFSIHSKRSANDGWGDVGTPNCSPTLVDGRWYCDEGVSYELQSSGTGKSDLMEIEYQVRRFSSSWDDGAGWAHGGSASQVCKVAYKPTVSVSSVKMSPNGMAVKVLHSDWTRGGNSYTLTCTASTGETIVRNYTVGGREASARVTVPLEKMSYIPLSGETVVVNLTATTCDGVRSTAKNTVPLAYDTGYSGTISPTVTDQDGLIKRVSFGSEGVAKLWVVSDGEAKQVENSGGNVFYVPYPLGCEYSMVGIVEYTDGTWKVWSNDYSSESVARYMWNWGSSGWFDIEVGKDSAPKLNYTNDRDYEANLTNANDYEVVQMGASRKQGWTVKGILVVGDDDVEDKLREFEGCGHCWFRDPFHRVIRVAVVGFSVEYGAWGHAEVSVTMRRTA